MHCAKTTARRGETHLSFGIWCDWYWRFYGTAGTSTLTSTTINGNDVVYNDDKAFDDTNVNVYNNGNGNDNDYTTNMIVMIIIIQ